MVNNEQRGEEAIRLRQLQPRSNKGSYVEVVSGNKSGTGSRRPVGSEIRSYEGSWSSVYLDVPETEFTRVKEAWVGRLKNLAMFDKVEDDLYWDDGEDVVPKYMGDDMILLLGLTDERAKQMTEEEQ